MSNYPGQTNDQGLIQFVGDYINKDTPLWLSMFGPSPGPGNVQVSSITVSAPGFVNLQASTIQTVPSAVSEYAPVIFQRSATDVPTYNTSLKMNVSNNVQGITPDAPFLSVTKQDGVFYDDLAVNGVQIFGNQFTDANINNGCVGYLTATTQNDITLKTNPGTSFNVATANISTLNVSSLSANSITATTFISSSTAVSQNLQTATANISTANISTANISTATISNAGVSTLSARRAVIQTNTLTSALLLNTDGIDINSQFALRQRGILPFGGVDMIASPANGGTIRMFTGSQNVNTVSASNLSMELRDTGTVTVFRDLNVSTISTGTIISPFISVSSILTNDVSFRPSLAPSVDLGLGGIVGGLVGGASANAFNTVLGASALGTGIAGLTLPRTSGGLNPNQFQTIAGTSQIQFSTLGSANTFSQSTPTGFLTTTNGVGNFGSTISTNTTLRAGTWAFRTASDPLNIATNPSTIGATSTIQAVGQWNKVFPGSVSMGVANNNITTLDGQNYIDMGGSSNSPFKIDTNFPNSSGDYPPSDPIIAINPRTEVVIGWVSPGFVPPPGYTPPGSQLRVSTIVGVSTINSIPFPGGVGVPVGSMLMWPVGSYNVIPNPPPGYLWCNGALLNVSDYPALGGLLGATWSPTYPSVPAGKFYLPDTRGRLPMGGIPSLYQVQASFQGQVTINLPGGGSVLGAHFNEIQVPGTGGPGQLYRGMQGIGTYPSGKILNLFSAGGDSGSGWYDDMYLLFDVNYTLLPGLGTNVIFQMTDSTDVPTVGLTNIQGGTTSTGYGAPYRVQKVTEVAPHVHSGRNGGNQISAPGNTRTEPSSGDTGNPNGQFSINGVGQVAEAYPQNPANFGVTFIIKAL